jgi:hypothetical protein
MPCTYAIDSDREVVVIRAEGVFTDQELLALSRKIAADLRYHSEYRFFCDFTQVTRNRLSADSLGYVPTLLKHSPASRCVILFAKKLLDLGMFRMYEAYCSIKGTSLPQGFHERGKALACLNEGVPPGKMFV